MIAIALMAGGFFVAWLAAEALVATGPHPLHWVTAFAGAGVGYLVGIVVDRLRHDTG